MVGLFLFYPHEKPYYTQYQMGLRDNLAPGNHPIFPWKKRGFHWQLFVTSGTRSLLAKQHQLVPHRNGGVAWPAPPRRTRDPFERSLLRRGWWWCRTTPRRMALRRKSGKTWGRTDVVAYFMLSPPIFSYIWWDTCMFQCLKLWMGDLGKMMTNDGILRYCTQFWDRPEPCEFFTHFPG